MIFFFTLLKKVSVVIGMAIRIVRCAYNEKTESGFNQNILLEASRHTLVVFNEVGAFL